VVAPAAIHAKRLQNLFIRDRPAGKREPCVRIYDRRHAPSATLLPVAGVDARVAAIRGKPDVDHRIESEAAGVPRTAAPTEESRRK
jgi:hypothetical protein